MQFDELEPRRYGTDEDQVFADLESRESSELD